MTARFLKIVVYGAVLTPLAFSPATFFPFLFPKALWFQTVVLAAVPTLALAIGRKRGIGRLLGPVGCAFGAFVVVHIIAAIFGIDPLRSFLGNEERMTGVLFSAHLFIFYFIARVAFPNAASWRKPLATSIIITALVGAIGAVVLALGRQGIYWFGFEPGGRIAGTIDNPAFYAATALVHAFLACYLAFTASTRRSRSMFLGLAALLGIFVWFTGTRGALVGLVGALLVAGAAWLWRKIPRFAAIGILALIMGAFLYAASDLHAWARASGGTVTTRILTWETALDAARARPLLGWGPENFNAPFNLFYQPKQLAFSYYETWFDRAHNIILDTLTQTGVVGLLALAALVGVAFRRMRTLPTFPRLALVGALAGYLVQNLFLFDSIVPAITFAVLLVTVESSGGVAPTPLSGRPIGRTFGWGAALAGVVVALVAYLPTYAANAAAVRATTLMQTDIPAGVRAFEDVFRRPLNMHLTEPRKELALQAISILETPRGELASDALARAAAEAAEKLTAAHPSDAYFWFLRGRVETARGEFEAAERAFWQSLLLSPRRQQVIFGLAKLKFYEERLDEVLPLLRQTVLEAPYVAEVHWQYGLMTLAADSSDPAGGAEIRRAVSLGYQPKNDEERALIRELGGSL